MADNDRLTVLVFGGRNHRPTSDERWELASWFQRNRPSLVIHGGAPGADEWMSRLAAAMGIKVMCCKADWKKHGNWAGPLRNAQMADLLIENRKHGRVAAIMAPGGRGTANMMNRCEEHEITIIPLAKIKTQR